MTKAEEILKRHINRLNSINPKEYDDFETISYCQPDIIIEMLNAMERYAEYKMLEKTKKPTK